jgi:hypothetical protein
VRRLPDVNVRTLAFLEVVREGSKRILCLAKAANLYLTRLRWSV